MDWVDLVVVSDEFQELYKRDPDASRVYDMWQVSLPDDVIASLVPMIKDGTFIARGDMVGVEVKKNFTVHVVRKVRPGHYTFLCEDLGIEQ